VGSGILLALHFASWISSLSHTSVANSALLVSTNPVFVGIGAWFLLKERIHPRLIAGSMIALTGTFLISYGDLVSDGHAWFGDLLALGGALTLSGHLLIGRRQRQDIALTPYITVVYTIAAVLLTLLALTTGQNLFDHSLKDYGLFFALALGPQLLGHTSFNYSLKRITPSFLALILLIEPIASSLLAYIFLNEIPPASTFLGGTVILAGVLLALTRSESA